MKDIKHSDGTVAATVRPEAVSAVVSMDGNSRCYMIVNGSTVTVNASRESVVQQLNAE